MKELRKTFYLIRYRINFTICNIVAIYHNLPFTQVVIYIPCSCSRRITDRVLQSASFLVICSYVFSLLAVYLACLKCLPLVLSILKCKIILCSSYRNHPRSDNAQCNEGLLKTLCSAFMQGRSSFD